MDPGEQAIEAAAKIVEEVRKPPSNEVTLSNGIVLKLKPVPPFLVRQAVLSHKRPEPPVMFIKDKEREEVNPNDPAYLRAVEEYEALTSDTALNITLAAGTEVKSIPEGLFSPEDDGWTEILEYAGISTTFWERKLDRYLAWLRYYALGAATDITLVTSALAKGIGLTESEVQAAAESFRNRKARRADNRVPAKAD